MRTKVIVAILLIAVGVVALMYQGITYTTRGKDIDVGPIHVTTERSNHIPLPPILGAVALIGGVALLIADKRRGGHAA